MIPPCQGVIGGAIAWLFDWGVEGFDRMSGDNFGGMHIQIPVSDSESPVKPQQLSRCLFGFACSCAAQNSGRGFGLPSGPLCRYIFFSYKHDFIIETESDIDRFDILYRKSQKQMYLLTIPWIVCQLKSGGLRLESQPHLRSRSGMFGSSGAPAEMLECWNQILVMLKVKDLESMNC